MTAADISLTIGLIVALAVTVGNVRAWGWLGTIAASYVVATIYWRLGGPEAPFVAGMCDAAICLAVYFLARNKWEIVVGKLYLASVAVNMVYYFGTMGLVASLSHNDYAAILEAINWLALIWIGGTTSLQLVGEDDGVSAHSLCRNLYRLMHPVFRPRRHPPFTAKAHARR
jgi:hypothetical protein